MWAEFGKLFCKLHTYLSNKSFSLDVHLAPSYLNAISTASLHQYGNSDIFFIHPNQFTCPYSPRDGACFAFRRRPLSRSIETMTNAALGRRGRGRFTGSLCSFSRSSAWVHLPLKLPLFQSLSLLRLIIVIAKKQ